LGHPVHYIVQTFHVLYQPTSYRPTGEEMPTCMPMYMYNTWNVWTIQYLGLFTIIGSRGTNKRFN